LDFKSSFYNKYINKNKEVILMNKIKVLYDVVTTMKGKEDIKGILKVDARKDGVEVFGLNNEFEKSMDNGRMKAKMKAEVNCEGKTFKHESSTDFENGEGLGHGHGPHNFMKHMHMQHRGQNPSGMKFCGPREGLNKIAFVLGMLNSLKLEEKDDKSAVLTLNIKDIPDDMKKMIHEKIEQRKSFEGHEEFEFKGNDAFKGHHKFMKELHEINNPEIEINVWINKDSEVEKVLITANGKSNTPQDAHEMSVKAELIFY
jgi:hypothetical protein